MAKTNKNPKPEIDWKREIFQVYEEVARPTVSIFDDSRNEIMAMRGSGISWDKLASHLNRIFQIKDTQFIDGKFMARVAKKWKELDMIDAQKVKELSSFGPQSEGKIEVSVKMANPVVTPPVAQNPSTPLPNAASIGDTYKTVQEFILDAVKLSNPALHAKDLIEDTFHAYKGKPKKEMLEGLSTMLKNRTGR